MAIIERWIYNDRGLVFISVWLALSVSTTEESCNTGLCAEQLYLLVVWLYGRLKASIAVKEDRMSPILHKALGVNQEHGDLGSIFTRIKHL